MEGYRQTYNADGTPSSKSFEQAGNEPQATPSPYRTGGVVTRVQMSEDGSATVSTSEPRSAPKKEAPADAFAMDDVLGPVGLDRATAKSVVTIKGMGDSSAEAWVNMGVLRKAANGQGYELVQSAATPAPNVPAAAKPNDVPAPAKAEVAVDLSNVKGTSEGEEATLTSLKTDGGVHFESLITQAVQGKDLDVAAVAKEMGMEDGGDAITSMVAAHREAGAQVLRNIDPTISGEAFERWAQKDPDRADAIIRATLAKDLGPLAEAGRQYAAERANRIEAVVNGAGVETRREGGKLMLSRKALGLPTGGRGDFETAWISVQDALKSGALIIDNE
jgi:hypothetical protein